MIKLSIRRLTIKLEIVRNLAMLDRVLADIPNQSADTLVDRMVRGGEISRGVGQLLTWQG